MQQNDKIVIDENIHLSPLVKEDVPMIVKHLQAREIYTRTASIPYPYDGKDAEWFISHSGELAKEFGRHIHWAIRNEKGELIGVIGFQGKYGKDSHKDEVGYWIAKEYWGKGIMGKVLKKVCEIGQNEYGLVRIEAPIFAFNLHSQKVAEKCGFVLEGTLRKSHLKDGAYFDSKLFALIKE